MPIKVYELLMMGTIADMVAMDCENRYWVRKGLLGLTRSMSHSFLCMAKNAGLESSKKFWSAQDIGFSIAPQLNALGRLEDPKDAVKFLISSDKQSVENVGQRLKEINESRKKIDREIYQQIENKILCGQIDLKKDKVIVDANKNWPAGVIGLVAGKLMNNYGRPAMLFHLTEDGVAKGSCRSIEEFNIFKALSDNQDLLTSFGGHSCAAGLALDADKLPELKSKINQAVADSVPDWQLQPKILVDSTLCLSEVNQKLLSDLRMLEPFGNSNQLPIFLIKDVVAVKKPQLLKDKHLKLMIFSNGSLRPIIFFNRPDLYKPLLKNQDQPFELITQIVGNEWSGRTEVSLIGIDIKLTN